MLRQNVRVKSLVSQIARRTQNWWKVVHRELLARGSNVTIKMLELGRKLEEGNALMCTPRLRNMGQTLTW